LRPASDFRSDQFSFGLVLYEMAAGKKAFDRSESVQTMSAIVSEDSPAHRARHPRPVALGGGPLSGQESL